LTRRSERSLERSLVLGGAFFLEAARLRGAGPFAARDADRAANITSAARPFSPSRRSWRAWDLRASSRALAGSVAGRLSRLGAGDQSWCCFARLMSPSPPSPDPHYSHREQAPGSALRVLSARARAGPPRYPAPRD